MAVLTYRLNGGTPETWISVLPVADAQVELIMEQDFARSFALDIWDGADADVSAPATFRHEHFAG